MIYHLAVSDEFTDARSYRPASLDAEGFIHCSSARQLIEVANAMFHGRTDLILVTIDPDALAAPVVWEDCYDTGQRFPHVYGPLDPGAVTDVRAFPPSTDGSFGWGD